MDACLSGSDVDPVAVASGGALDAASFDGDLPARLDSLLTAGRGVQAFLWGPPAGDGHIAGHRHPVIGGRGPLLDLDRHRRPARDHDRHPHPLGRRRPLGGPAPGL